MIEFNPNELIDHDAIAAAQARLTDATQKLASAKAAVVAGSADVAEKWAESVRQVAAGGDVMAGAEAHGAAVNRRDFAAGMVDVAEKILAEEQEKFVRARILAHVPVLRKGRELRLAAATAHDAAKAALGAADALAMQGTRLLAAAHAGGLRHFNPGEAGRSARSEAAEKEYIAAEADAALAFWGELI
jgi:hypothetical protein